MPSYLFMRVASGLTPGDNRAYEALKKFKEGSHVRVDIAQVRSPAQLRKWWAMIDDAWENLPDELQRHYGDKYGLHAALLCHLGYCTEFRRKHPDGTETIIQRPKSIALGNMPDEEFDPLFDKGATTLEDTLGADRGTLRGEAAETSSERNLRGI